MGEVTTIGLDLAKHVFQVHGVDAEGATILRKQLRRAQVLAFFSRLPPCLVGLEACATAHYWGRELRALGHEARLMPAQYVKAYIKRNKHDAADAEAICEAIGRPPPCLVGLEACATAHYWARELRHQARTLAHQPLPATVQQHGSLARQIRQPRVALNQPDEGAMPRHSKGARLWFQPARRDDHGRIIEQAVWCIRDGGGLKRSTGFGQGEAAEAERALADYIAAKYSAPRISNRNPAACKVADVVAIYAEDVAHKHGRPQETAARLGRILDFFGETMLADISRKACDAYVRQRGAQAAARRELDCGRPYDTIGRPASVQLSHPSPFPIAVKPVSAG